ncbi:MAG: thiamine-phosphate kinase [Saprospiraceae bacterium]|nr:thiamine-phosphate kinase [Saprospiraceae bacterium]
MSFGTLEVIWPQPPNNTQPNANSNTQTPLNSNTLTVQRTDVNTLGEFGLIEHLTRDFPLRQSSSIKGVGDDAAVIDNGNLCTVVSTDLLVEGIHFDLAYTPLKHLGFKSVIVNLSDIYAMNAFPKQITVSIAISNRFSVEALDELYEGIRAACKAYEVDLVGGDTTSSPKGLTISVTAIGQGEKDLIVYRNGARPGDIMCITGELGGAYLGLQLLEREKRIWQENPDVQPDFENQQYAVGRQLKPEARRDVIEAFRKIDLKPTSMIDISDGLASEIFHICKQSNVGALLEENGVPINQEAQMLALKFKLDPITCALNGGEDYELLFTIRPEDIDKVKYLPDIYIAGEILEAKDGIKLNTKGGNLHDLKAQGWVHF